MLFVVCLMAVWVSCVVGGQGCACSGSRSDVTVEGEHAGQQGHHMETLEAKEESLEGAARRTPVYDCGTAYIPPGEFRMGSDDPEAHPEDDETPSRMANITNGYWMDKCEVSNQQFRRYVKATKWKSDAEVYGWSFVFEQFVSKVIMDTDPQAVEAVRWWRAIPHSWWRQPEGNDSTVKNRWDHPVVHVSWRDAFYYCDWMGGRLPTEEEWEFAARGGLEGQKFPWGDDLEPNGEHWMNVWQGHQTITNPLVYDFHNTMEDKFKGTAPIATFPPNQYGLHDMTGNVWEWTATEYTGVRQRLHERGTNADADACQLVEHRVKKGGSYMCHKDYCNRYRNAARQGLESDSSTGNLGFRCAYDREPTR